MERIVNIIDKYLNESKDLKDNINTFEKEMKGKKCSFEKMVDGVSKTDMKESDKGRFIRKINDKGIIK